MNIRWIAVKILEEVYEENHFLNEVLDGYFYTHEFDKHEKAFLNKVVYGTIEQQIKIDYIINQFSKVKVKKLKPFVYYVLSISIYQLLEMDHVPQSAVCNEAVKLIKKRKLGTLSGFVNGVLRTVSREIKYISYPSKEKELAEYVHVYYSLPKWLVDMMVYQYTKEQVLLMAEDMNMPPKLSVRLNTEKLSVEDFSKQISESGVHVESGTILPYALKLVGAIDLSKNQLFNEGVFTIQDESSMLVTEIMSPEPGSKVLDVCSAPGGKTCHIASVVGPDGSVEARDVSDRKIDKVKENAKRLGLGNINYKVMDGTQLDEASIEQFDYVLTDVPCSGLGIIKKKPDIKRFMTKEKIDSLKVVQKDILNSASRYVKIGGTLIYSTCTINKEENLWQLKAFLKKHKDFQLESIDGITLNENMILEDNVLQLIPIKQMTDGFFIAKLKRVMND